jgi:electron transfer flavoprotein alpha subunit
MSNTLVIAHVLDGHVTDLTLQAVAKARTLGNPVHGLVIGNGVSSLAVGLTAAGCDVVHVAEKDVLATYVTTPFLRVAQSVVQTGGYSLILLPASTMGNDLAPVLAARLNAACVLDADDVKVEGDKTLIRRTEFDRKAGTWFSAVGGKTMVATVKDGVADTPVLDAARVGTVHTVAVSLDNADLKARVLSRDVAKATVNLKGAKIIVAAGAGVGNKDNFAKITDLAAKLGAQIGATRAVVDAGWLPADHQIGQTGATVRPDLYIACGISGAVQHWVGMMDSRTIVSINSDKNAPLMKRAHYRIAGDLNVVIPKLIKLMP